jgi:hypothetical protein
VKTDTHVEGGLLYGIAKVYNWQTPGLRLNHRRRTRSNHNKDVEAEHIGNGRRNFTRGATKSLTKRSGETQVIL